MRAMLCNNNTSVRSISLVSPPFPLSLISVSLTDITRLRICLRTPNEHMIDARLHKPFLYLAIAIIMKFKKNKQIITSPPPRAKNAYHRNLFFTVRTDPGI